MGIRAMAENNIFAVLLPTTAYILRIRPPPARDFIHEGLTHLSGIWSDCFLLTMITVNYLRCTHRPGQRFQPKRTLPVHAIRYESCLYHDEDDDE